MNVLNRDFSTNFDPVYIEATKNRKVQFKFTTQIPNPNLRYIKGLRNTEQKNGKEIVTVYLNEDLETEEIEQVAVHELCHEIVRSRGFDYSFRVNQLLLKEKIEKKCNVK